MEAYYTNENTLYESNLSFGIELLDELPTRQVRSLMTQMTLDTLILT